MANENIIFVDKQITQNDIGIIFGLTARDDKGNEIILTDTEVWINIKRGRSPEPLHKQCEIIEPELGKFQYIIQDGDLSIGGATYQMEYEIHYPDGSVVTSQEVIEFDVRKQIA